MQVNNTSTQVLCSSFFFIIKEGAEHVQNSALAHHNLTSDFRFKLVPRNCKQATKMFRTWTTGLEYPSEVQDNEELRPYSLGGCRIFHGDILARDVTSCIQPRSLLNSSESTSVQHEKDQITK